MDVQRDRRYFKRGVLGLARPDQLRVEVWVVGVSLLLLTGVGVGFRRHQADRRVIDTLLVAMLVGFDRAFGFGLLLSCHYVLPVLVSSFGGSGG